MKSIQSWLGKQILWLFVIPGLLGMLLFYIIPYFASFYYALTDVGTGKFIGFENYVSLFGNVSFQVAVRNTLLFTAICVPLNVVLPFVLAYFYHTSGKRGIFVLALMLPLVMPSGATVYFWRILFGNYGLINKILVSLGMESIIFFQSDVALYVVILVFVIKNIGFNMVLFITGLSYIPSEYYELARIEGCSAWNQMRRITLVYIVPTAFMTVLMAIVNSFKIFREIYLLFGDYPHTSVYMVQHYINNLFSGAVLQRLSTASTIISLFVAVIVGGLYFGQRKLARDL